MQAIANHVQPIKRGTTRSACVRELLGCGSEGLDETDLICLMAEQNECSNVEDTASARKYISRVLREEALFTQVRAARETLPSFAVNAMPPWRCRLQNQWTDVVPSLSLSPSRFASAQYFAKQ
jgi:hypothetical protein